MPNCSDQSNQNINGAIPSVQNEGAVQVNLNQNEQTIFNPTFALAALNTFNTFNNVANKMFGYEVRWFRAVPQQRSKDTVFKEYTLSNVEDIPLCIKVIVPDGNFPDSKYQFDLMGLEYEVPLEIQIDKKYWEEIAGFGTAPQKKDIVYLVISNKLYQVESSFLKRGFMEQETTWVINLKKYSPEASRREGDALSDTIDRYTVSEQELFGDLQNSEYIKITNDKQMSPFNSTEKDKYKILDTSLKILNLNIDIYGTIAAQSVYDMNSSKTFNAVEYKNPTSDLITTTSDRALMSWVMPIESNKEYDVLMMEPNTSLTSPANYRIQIKGAKRFNINDVFVISRSGALNLYAKVINIIEMSSGIYWCQIDQPIIDYLTSIKSNWYELKGFKMKVKDPISLINGINETTIGYKICIFANQYIKLNYGSQEIISVLDEQLENNKWYGIVANIGNNWNQFNVNVWEQHPSDSTIKLRLKFNETLTLQSEEVNVQRYTLNKSYSYMANIRLFNTTIEEEKQSKELLSYFTKDADQGIILDNCDDILRAPYISQQR